MTTQRSDQKVNGQSGVLNLQRWQVKSSLLYNYLQVD